MLLLAAAPAQELRLAERVSAPLLYMAVDAAPSRSDVAEAACGLLSDLEALGIEVGGARGQEPGGGEPERARSALDMLLGLLEGSASGMAWNRTELALTGLLPRPSAPSLPLLVFRAALLDDAADRMQGMLDEGRIARPSRIVAGRQVWALGSAAADQPGGVIEVALVGNDLIVANHGAAIEETLGDQEGREALAADAAYRTLCGKLGAAAGTVLLYADLARLRHRVAGLLERGSVQLARWSGLLAAQSLLLALRPADTGVRASLLLAMPEPLDGALALLRQARVDELVRHVPDQGVGGVALALDPGRLIAPMPARRPGDLLALRNGLTGRCIDLGLDLERQVLARLGSTCAVHIVEVDAGYAPVVVVETRGQPDARRLLADCRQTSPVRAASPAAGDRMVARAGGRQVHLGVLDGHLVIALDERAFDLALSHASPTAPGRRLLDSLQQLDMPRRDVSAVFRVDLASRPPLSRERSQTFFGRRHVGYAEVEGGLLRIEMLTAP